MQIDVKVPEVFLPLDEPARYKAIYGGRGCCHPDTLVDTPNGHVKISEFSGGDILAFDGDKVVIARALAAREYDEQQLYRVVLNDDREISVTDEHKFLTSRGWLMLRELRLSDELYAVPDLSEFYPRQTSVKKPILTRIKRICKHDRLKYWDLHVPILNNYLSNGIVNHNSGKSHNRAEALIFDALDNKGLRAVCIREVQKTLKESSKRLIEDKLSQFRLGEAQGFKVYREVIETPGDGIVIFQGMQDHTADSIKSLEGYDRAWVEEAQTMTDRSLTLLRPTIRAANSELWFTWNPRRKNDPVDMLFRSQLLPTNSTVIKANWSDNPFFPAVLDQERRDCLLKDPDQYDHIWEGGYATINKGAYFVREMQECKRQNRITRVPQDPLLPVRAFVDIGGTGAKADAFAMWICQFVSREIRVLNYYEVQGQPFPAHVEWLRRNNYIPGKCDIWLPHDGATQDRVFDVSYQSAFATAGYNVNVVPNQGKGAAMQRIEAVRRWLHACWFNEETTVAGRDALGWYHEKIDEVREIGLGPDHDWSSHGCFTGETEVLTRYGMYQIMNLPKYGEVLTSCGWKQYINPRITRKNARLVEVRFNDGHTVKCTPDHLFKTVNGWISAERLTPNTVIQSTLTKLPNILTGGSIGCGRLKDIYHEVAGVCTGMFGSLRLGEFLTGVTSTIKTVIYSITDWITSNAYPQQSICVIKIINQETTLLQMRPVSRPLNGIDPLRAVYGINDMLNVRRGGRNGSAKTSLVRNAARFLKRLCEKAATPKSIVQVHAKPLLIESVKEINGTADVWCMTVPEAGEFSLANGAIVHNCDAFGLMAITAGEQFEPVKQPQRYQAISWMG